MIIIQSITNSIASYIFKGIFGNKFFKIYNLVDDWPYSNYTFVLQPTPLNNMIIHRTTHSFVVNKSYLLV